jgi:asparagine synthase (glutamine-hydrolysing)
MCGIAGLFGANASSSVLAAMLSRIEHRGDPEHADEMAQFPGAAIGANRLAIVDEDHGRQPVPSPSGRWVCVFNGEIYNHRELRGAATEKLRTECDTEVIANGLEAQGPDFIRKLRGMFAIAAFDKLAGNYVLARDPLGIKPLYVAQTNDAIAVASEMKALCAIEDVARIDTIMPGTIHTKDRVVKYAQLPTFATLACGDADAVTLVRDAFVDAVKACLPQPGTPVAILLSGGIDSSTLLLVASKIHRGPVEAFTFASTEAISEDLTHARLIAQQCCVRLTVVWGIESELTSFYLQKAVRMLESFEPALVRNATSYYFLCRAVRAAGYKFALSGEGADEIFGGYDYFRRAVPSERDPAIGRSLQQLHRTYLQMADRASMAARLEVRVPYLDYLFARTAAQLPADTRIRGQRDKWLLRHLFVDEVPFQIRMRPKLGMNGGAGFGSNDPGEGIYERAVANWYLKHGTLEDDRRLARQIGPDVVDEDDCEEVYNAARLVDHRMHINPEVTHRPQVNTSRLRPNPARATDFA